MQAKNKFWIILFAGVLLTAVSWYLWVFVLFPPRFSKDIAPIIYTNCVECHRSGEAGPFPLVTYDDVKDKARTVKLMTIERRMPPWPADPNYRHFLGERHLSDEQIALIARWVDAGCPEGDPKDLPSLPDFSKMQKNLKPDMVITFPNKLLIEGSNKDKFVVMKFPYELEKDTFLKYIEFIPGNKKLLHHMNGHLVQFEEGKKKAINDGEWQIDQDLSPDSRTNHRKLGLLNDDGSYSSLVSSVTNYLPGGQTASYPEGIGGYMLKRKGMIYVNNIHYGPTPVDRYDSSSFYLYFSSKVPQRPVSELIMGTLGVSPIEPRFVIPPNEIKHFHTEIDITQDVSLLSLNPHMHLIGKSFKAYAIDPKSDTVPLIRIPQWDFRWQYFYKFPKMLKIEAGSRICVDASFDNTSKNPNNPFFPPQLISGESGSMRTTDEMLQFIFTYVKYRAGDENISLED